MLLAAALAAPAAALAGETRTLRPLTLQLNWKHQFQFAGYYAAIEKGYYRREGFDVRLVEAQEGREPVDEVLKGNAEFGVGASSSRCASKGDRLSCWRSSSSVPRWC